jgi:hypothetical protein
VAQSKALKIRLVDIEGLARIAAMDDFLDLTEIVPETQIGGASGPWIRYFMRIHDGQKIPCK